MSDLRGVPVLVTGAGGFLGPAVVRALARQGASVHALIAPPGVSAVIPAQAVRVSRADVRDAAGVAAAVAGSEIVVHLAGPASVAASFRNPAEYVAIHAGGTAVVLDRCARSGVRTIVYVSSAEVYGRPGASPVGEDQPLSARSPYAAAKIAAEKLVEAHVHARGAPAVILRPFSVYGPGASPSSLVEQIVSRALGGESVSLSDLRPVRDYCFVDDVADAVARACSLELDGLATFNVGTMEGTSVRQLADLVLDALGRRCPVVEAGARDRPGDSDLLELVADNRRARDRLGWKPSVPLREGLRLTIGRAAACVT